MAKVYEDISEAIGDWAHLGDGPLTRRLARAIRQAIRTGGLEAGYRLPPERRLAQSLAVSRSTVAGAMDQLRGEGLVASRQGHGTVILGTTGPGNVPVSRVADLMLGTGGGINLATATPADASHLPELTVSTADLLPLFPADGIDPLGLPALREALAARHSATGLITNPDEIHVTSGAVHAVHLAVEASVRPGARVVVEDPTYAGVLDVLAHHRLEPVIVRSDDAGPLPESLDEVIRRTGPSLAYLTPGMHNPLGTTMPVARRRAIAEVLDRHELTTIEDNTLSDTAFGGRIHPELAELCRHALVVTVESFSKVTWAGLRTGWMRAPSVFIERTRRIRAVISWGAPFPSQLMALRLLDHLDGVAADRRTRLAESCDRLLEGLALDLPTWSAGRPQGGLVVWAALPTDDSAPFVQLARRYGVQVVPGFTARVHRRPSPYVRICFDRPAPQLDEGVRRLALAWAEYTDRSPHVVG